MLAYVAVTEGKQQKKTRRNNLLKQAFRTFFQVFKRCRVA